MRTSRSGVTLLDTLVGTSLMLVVFLGINAAFRLSVDVITTNKARAGAIALANERMSKFNEDWDTAYSAVRKERQDLFEKKTAAA